MTKLRLSGLCSFWSLHVNYFDPCSSGAFSVLCLIYLPQPITFTDPKVYTCSLICVVTQMDRAIPRSHNPKETALPFKEAESSISSLHSTAHTWLAELITTVLLIDDVMDASCMTQTPTQWLNTQRTKKEKSRSKRARTVPFMAREEYPLARWATAWRYGIFWVEVAVFN
jgi:hypothetical protein